MVNSAPRVRTRLPVGDRRQQLIRLGAELIATRSWDDLTMGQIAAAAGVSKPLLYHYFSTKTDLYRATVTAAAEELREATRPDPDLPIGPRMSAALDAHLDWIDAHALAYRAVIQGGISSDVVVQDVVEQSRSETLDRLAEAFGIDQPTEVQRIAFRGWIGFLEWTSIEWLATKAITKRQLADLLTASAAALVKLAS